MPLLDEPRNSTRKRPLDDASDPIRTQRKRTSSQILSSPVTSSLISRVRSSAADARSYQELASFTKGDTQVAGKSQDNDPPDAVKKAVTLQYSYEDPLVTDPITSPTAGLAFFNGFEPVQFPITPGLSRRSITTERLSSYSKTATIKTPGSALRRMFGGADGGGISLTQAFLQTPSQAGPHGLGPYGPKSDPIFQRPSPNWVQIESPGSYTYEAQESAGGIETLHQPQNPQSESRRHRTLDSDDVFMPPQNSVAAGQEQVPLIIRDSDETHASEITLHAKTPLLRRIGTPDERDLKTPLSQVNRLQMHQPLAFPYGTTDDTIPKKDVVIAATPNSDRIPDSQSLSQPNGRTELPSSPPMISIPQSQGRSVGVAIHFGRLGTQAREALATSLPRHPTGSDIPTSSPKSSTEDVVKIPCTGDSRGKPESQLCEPVILDMPTENVEEQRESCAENSVQRNVESSQANRLKEIAAEPSQSINESFPIEFLDDDDEDDQKSNDQDTLKLTGSSPINPRNRRSRPRLLKSSPVKSQPRNAKSRRNSVISQLGDDSQALKHISTHELEVLQFIPNVSNHLSATAPVLRNTITRPLNFLRDQNARKIQRNHHFREIEKTCKSIWEFEDTQTLSRPDKAQNDFSVKDQEANYDQLEETTTDTTGLPTRFPDRIFAYCKNPYNACYPAKFLGVRRYSDGKHACDVLFDDGTTVTVPPGQAEKWIFKLELKLGDVVKVEGKKGKMFVVLGFTTSLQAPATHSAKQASMQSRVDIYGHEYVVLEPKSRESGASANETVGLNQVVEPISNVIIAPKEFQRHADRVFVPPVDVSVESTHSTPHSTGTSSAPPSRRHSTSLDAAKPPAPSVVSKSPGSSLFDNMAFAVSIEDEEKKRSLIRDVKSNGGQVLDLGFEPLFDLSNSILSESCRMGISKTSSKTMSFSSSLSLNPNVSELGFTAVIADSHSRKEKHMQALALGLPVLHHRWIEHCVTRSSLAAWPNYLLPAGASSYLDGAIKSRFLDSYDSSSATAQLKRVLGRRALLLEDKKVIVVPGKGNVLSKRQRAFVFLMMALGVSSLMQVCDMETARKMRGDQGWDYIYADVDGGAKTKREQKIAVGADKGIISDEFVAQSLILGEVVC